MQTSTENASQNDAPDLSALHVAVIGAGNMGGPVVATFLRGRPTVLDGAAVPMGASTAQGQR